MKSKYKSLVKIRLEEQKMQESLVFELKSDIATIEDKIKYSLDLIKNIDIPTTGEFSLILQARNIMKIIQKEINESKSKLEEKEEELNIENEKLIQINIEYEKANYLFKEERKKQLLLIEKAEQDELDDIGQKIYQNKS